MSDDFKGFKRVNFFTGFQTTAEDWNAVVRYGVEKNKLLNRLFHGPGVVPGELGGLKVTARGRADLSVEVASGYALDGEGNLLYLPEPEIKTINPGDFKLPQTVYIVLKYVEDLTDFVSYRANLEYKGHRRVAEQVKVEAIITEPDIGSEVEVARVRLTKGAKRIADAKDAFQPQNNEIDRRFVPQAGTTGSRLDRGALVEMAAVLNSSRRIYSHMFHKMRILTAADVLSTMTTMEMFLKMNVLDASNLFDLFATVFEQQSVLVEDIEENYPAYSSKKEFISFKKHVELLSGMYREGKFSTEFLTNIIGYQAKSTENLQRLVGAKIKVAKKEAKKASVEVIAEAFKLKSDEFAETIEVEGAKFVLVDMIDVLNKKSEQVHKFRIVDAKDKYRTRQKLKYPDGVIVEDAGIAFEGGYAEWEVSNIIPNRDLFMVTRMDYVHGDWEAEIAVNGKKVGTSICAGDDRKFRWRNWPFKVSAEYITDTFLTIKKTPTKYERDINMFKIWFYQPAE